MTTNIKHYVTQFNNVFDGEPWYGKSLMSIVNEVLFEQVYQKESEAHSIYEILSHILAWRELFVKRLNGDTTSNIEINSLQDWSPQPEENKKENWEKLLKKLSFNQLALVTALEKITDDKLEKEFTNSQASLETHLEGNLQHDIYHSAQIALLKNLFKSESLTRKLEHDTYQ